MRRSERARRLVRAYVRGGHTDEIERIAADRGDPLNELAAFLVGRGDRPEGFHDVFEDVVDRESREFSPLATSQIDPEAVRRMARLMRWSDWVLLQHRRPGQPTIASALYAFIEDAEDILDKVRRGVVPGHAHKGNVAVAEAFVIAAALSSWEDRLSHEEKELATMAFARWRQGLQGAADGSVHDFARALGLAENEMSDGLVVTLAAMGAGTLCRFMHLCGKRGIKPPFMTPSDEEEWAHADLNAYVEDRAPEVWGAAVRNNGRIPTKSAAELWGEYADDERIRVFIDAYADNPPVEDPEDPFGEPVGAWDLAKRRRSS